LGRCVGKGTKEPEAVFQRQKKALRQNRKEDQEGWEKGRPVGVACEDIKVWAEGGGTASGKMYVNNEKDTWGGGSRRGNQRKKGKLN